MAALRKPGWLQWLMILALLLATGITVLHASRTYRRALYWREHRDEPLRAWMSVNYVAHAYHVPPHRLYLALGLRPQPPDRRPLGVIAKAQKRSPAAVLATVKDAIEQIRSEPTPLPGGAQP